MLRDPRPPVLYLRSFGDDRLRLWRATFGRPSLVERFTPRRSDRFEEVLVRYLSRYGPVIAVNPPGNQASPLGAARETIEPADWQSAVANWMARAALIVFLAPPSRVTQGLHWELRTVAEHGQLDKALVVVPPVSAEQLQARWRAFGAACAGLWPFTVARPLADPRALVLAFRRGRWDVATADTRTEWSYAAALDQVLGDPRRTARPVARGAPARRAPGAADAAGRGADRRGGRRHGGRGNLVRLDKAPAARSAVVLRRRAPSAPPPRPCGTARSGSAGAPRDRPPSRPVSPSSVPATTGPARPSLAPVAALYPGATRSRRSSAGTSRRSTAAITPVPGHAEPGQRDDHLAFPGRVRVHPGFGRARHRDRYRAGRAPGRDVTFTSRQQPQDGPEGESCTNWQVTMYFDGNAGTYTIGAPPNGYKAAYQACS